MATLMLVEDDDKIGSLLRTALEANGHVVSWQRTGASSLACAQAKTFDLVLLDVGLPDLDGVEVCRELKLAQPQCVVVMLTARREEIDVIVGLESGADDYLTKPFRLTELLARVRAHLRRRSGPGEQPVEPFVSGDLSVDTGSRRAVIRGSEVSLRPKEFELLVRLVVDADRAVSREDLISDVWDENWFGSTKTLDVHMASLRRRLSEAASATSPPAAIPQITTLRGHGYRLDSVPRARESPSSRGGH